MGQDGSARVRSRADEADRYLIFACDGQRFAIEIHRVQEIRGWERVMHFPHSEDFAMEVMDLRGSMVPVVNFRRCMGQESTSSSSHTVVIVVFTGSVSGPANIGFIVDAVSEVQDLSADSTAHPSRFDTFGGRAFVGGTATIDDKAVMLLDVDELVEASLSSAAILGGRPRRENKFTDD